MNPDDMAALRVECARAPLDEQTADPDPIRQFTRWYDQALRAGLTEPNAMGLATVDLDGRPNCRMVLLKAFSAEGFVFFTNYDSIKGVELDRTPWAALVLYWAELGRQVRIAGPVSRTSEAESDAYFQSRPVASRRGAAISCQSQVIPDRQWLEERLRELRELYPEGGPPRPKRWGGLRVHPRTVEFWQERPDRLHDRLLYTADSQGGWRLERLAP